MNAMIMPVTNLPTKYRAAARISQRSSGKDRGLVSVCAWCPPETYQPLKENEAYTHGICRTHRRKLLTDLARTRRTASAAN